MGETVKPHLPYSAAQFNKSVAVLCKNLGANEIEPAYPSIKVQPTFQFETPYGALTIRAIDDYIACRFLEPKRAADVLSWQSMHNGKWNFHSSRFDRRDTFLHFSQKLQAVLQRRARPLQSRLPMDLSFGRVPARELAFA